MSPGRPALARIFVALFLRPSLRRPHLLIASLLGIAAGTAILCALNLANERALRSFSVSAAGLPGSASAGAARVQTRLRSPRGRVPVFALERCLSRAATGVRCRGVVTGTLRVELAGQEAEVRLLGIDGAFETVAAPLFASALFQRAQALRVVFPAADAGPQVVLRAAGVLPLADDAVVLDFPDAWALLARAGTGGRSVTGAALAAPREPGYDYLEISAATDAELDAAIAGLHAPLRRTSAAEQIESHKALTATYRFNLRVLGLLSIFIGALLVRNVAALYCLLKRPALSVLRQLGASRRLLLFLVLCEQVVLGLVGGVLGLLLGVRLEEEVSRRVLSTVSDLYVKTAAARRELTPAAAALTVLAGMALFLLAGAQATLSLGQVAPAALGKRAQREAAGQRSIGRALLLALGCAVFLFLSPRIPAVPLRLLTDSDAAQPIGGYLAAGAVFVIALALSQLSLEGVAAAAARLLRGDRAARLPALSIAARRSQRAGGRGRAAVTTLAGGLGLVVGIQLMVGGFRDSFDRWLDAIFPSDWAGDIRSIPGTEARPRLLETDLAELRRVPGVYGVDCALHGTGAIAGRPIRLGGVEDALPAGVAVPNVLLRALPGLDAVAAERLVQRDARYALVSEPLATKFQAEPGRVLTVDLGAGAPQPLTVAAVVRDYSTELGYLFLNRQRYGAIVGLDGCHAVRVYARPGASDADRAQTIAALEREHPQLADKVRLFPVARIRTGAQATFDQTFAVTGILTVLAAVLGGLALLVQVLQSAAERAPEWLTLRRLGTTWGGLLRLCAAEVFLAVLSGTLLGLLTGGLLGWVLCFAINKQAFGWSVAFLTPASVRGALGVAAVFAAILWALGALLSLVILRPGERFRVTRE